MTEAEWLTCQSPRRLFRQLGWRPSRRKLRCFFCEVAWRIWRELPDATAESVTALKCDLDMWRESELKAPGLLSDASLAFDLLTSEISPTSRISWRLVVTGNWDMHYAKWIVTNGSPEIAPLICDAMRDIFGNPFRPVAFNPAWRTSDVLLLARGIYEGRAFDRMPILADALQDAGCDSDDILGHCRDPKQLHARGCWVVDLVLGKQ